MYQIENEWIRLTVNQTGAEMFSVYSKKDDFEYLWDGNPDFWKFHAPICFPIIGTLKEDTCMAEDKYCHMTVHGFARDMSFVLIEQTEKNLIMKLSSDSTTLEKYPYQFELTLTYTLEERQIKLEYDIQNIDKKTMYYSIGAHTAYRCPLEPDDSFHDYYLKFEEENEELSCILLENGVPTEKHRKLPGGKGILPLSYELFDNGILILDQLKSEKVTLCSAESAHSVTVEYKNFPYLGIWTKNEGCPFLCIEPWDGLPDYADADGKLKNKKGIRALEARRSVRYLHTMTFL